MKHKNNLDSIEFYYFQCFYLLRMLLLTFSYALQLLSYGFGFLNTSVSLLLKNFVSNTLESQFFEKT